MLLKKDHCMGKNNSETIIENENLFRALTCAPISFLFTLLAANSVMSSGIVIFQVLFILLALFFTYNTLAYAAHYTNERFSGQAETALGNENLSKAVKFFPLAVVFVFFAMNAITSSSHLVFQVILVLLALTFVLSTLSYAAFYTNDYHAEKAEAH